MNEKTWKVQRKRNQFHYWKFGKIRCWEATHTRCVVRYSADARERGVEAHGPRQREEELRKVRYKPEELGLYIDDLHAPLKPKLQRLFM